jgi:hypothetical protein
MKIVELIIDEKDKLSGIDAVSVVQSPAIEENFIYLSKHEIELKEVDTEKRILMGAALIPDKQIFRRNKEEEYYIFFSKDTVRQASELFLMNSNQNNTTYEHDQKLKGLSVVESWIIEDEKQDKSVKYGFSLPIGTWMISMKVNNDEVWQDVKDGKVKGFSIEGYFADKLEMNMQEAEDQELLDKIKDIILNSEIKLAAEKISFDYDDTLSTENGTALAKRKITEGYDVYIISARDSKDGMLSKAQEIGIPESRIYATGSNDNKIAKVKELGISVHYDNNKDVIDKLDGIGKLIN